MQPTLIEEPADTREVAEAAETAPSPSEVKPTAQPSAPEVEAAPRPWRKAGRLRRAGAVAAALAVVFGLAGVYMYLSAGPAVPAEKAAAADTTSTAAPVLKVSEPAADAPDNSVITTTTAPDGTRTETRAFKSHALVSKVVVTTSGAQRTARVTSLGGDERELPAEMVPGALEASGDELAAAVGFAPEKGQTKEPTKVASQRATSRTKGAGTQQSPPPVQKNVIAPQNNLPAQQQTSSFPEGTRQSRALGPEGRGKADELKKQTAQQATQP